VTYWTQVAAGVISAEEAEQELDVCKALAELVVIATEIGEVPTSPEEKMRLEEKVLSRWP
jgi:hypothetical protein